MGNIQIYEKSGNKQLSDHFFSREFRCRGSDCCHTTHLDDTLLTFLQQIRNHFQQPVTINSGYRCPTHNASIGGAPSSYHCRGMAADIAVKDTPPATVATYCQRLGIPGIGLYETPLDGYFVHIDTRPQPFYWYGQACLPRAGFDGDPLQDFLQELSVVTGTQDPQQLLKVLPTVCRQYNACHAVVAPLQRYLAALGYAAVGTADGIAGQKFTTALTQFQADHLCAPTGVAEQWGKTWHILLGGAP